LVSLEADGDGLREGEFADVDHADCIALAVGDVGVFAIGGAVVGQSLLAEVPPGEPAEDGEQDDDEEKFFQESAYAVERKD
jgi:hypothetical protein